MKAATMPLRAASQASAGVRAGSHTTAPPALHRFLISVHRADGSASNFERTGGCAAEHAMQAMDEAGLGAVVRVLPMREAA